MNVCPMLTYLFRKQRSESFEFPDVAFVEDEEEFLYPVVGRTIESVEDWVGELEEYE